MPTLGRLRCTPNRRGLLFLVLACITVYAIFVGSGPRDRSDHTILRVVAVNTPSTPILKSTSRAQEDSTASNDEELVELASVAPDTNGTLMSESSYNDTRYGSTVANTNDSLDGEAAVPMIAHGNQNVGNTPRTRHDFASQKKNGTHILPISAVSVRMNETSISKSRSGSHYEFVAFKKKPGWNFVKFPYDCQCKEGVSVTVRYTECPAEIVGADVVFFSTGPFTFEEWRDLHHNRTTGQIWVMATQEPASIVPRLLPPKVYRHTTYNWSFTFHSSSDIHGAYGWFEPSEVEHKKLKEGKKRNKNKEGEMMDWHSAKPEVAAWVSSRHCEGLGWNRTEFVTRLSKLIPIDMYGACGQQTLPRRVKLSREVLCRYKFHLSLENSCCSEYLSEKVWNALAQWESVPIVLGGTKEEYRRLMPPNSYIHVDDFASIENLAEYMSTLSRNATMYNSYMRWRSLGTVRRQHFEQRFPVFGAGACKVARKVEETRTDNSGEVHHFDPYGPTWFGSCYKCGDHNWVQGYNFLWRRTLFNETWGDERTLYWLDKD